MALEPQPRSHQPCRPGAETGEQSARARSRSLDFRGETRVAVRRQAAGDGAMGRGGLSKGNNTLSTRALQMVTVATGREQVPAPVLPL
jgi:hypothetical protein